MKLFASFAFAIVVLLAFHAPAANAPFYVGCYTKPDGSRGIYRFQLDLETGQVTGGDLAAEANSPSFLAVDPSGSYLYSANEAGTEGGVGAYEIQEDGSLKTLNTQSSKGSGACHVWVDDAGKTVLVANYGSGSIACLPIKDDGSLREASTFEQHVGYSVNPQRQKEPHAHSIYTGPAGRFVYACDLGTDKVYIYRFNAEEGTLKPNNPAFGAVPPGSGPRHLAIHPSNGLVYVINEMASTITTFKRDEQTGALEAVDNVSTLPKGFEGNSSTAEIFIHPTGRFLYGSNRGHNSIAVFAIDGDSGKLTPIDYTPTGGQTPRNFAIDPTGKWLIAANQDSNDLFVFKIDPATGKLAPVGQRTELGAPVCVLFPPRK